MIYAILLFGLDIVVGYTGQVSLGHAGLFGIGAYTAGVLVTKLGTPLLVTLLGAIGVTALFGAMLALPALRVTGPVPRDGDARLRHHHPDPDQRDDLPHRRPDGHQAHQAARCSAIKLDEREFYWLVAVLLVLSLVVVHRILRSHLGRAFEALRGSPVASRLHGRLGLPLQGLRVRDQRRLRRPGGRAVRVLRAVHLAEHLQLRADGAVPARGDHGRPQDAASARMLGAAIIVLLPKLLDDIELFRYVSVGARGAGR